MSGGFYIPALTNILTAQGLDSQVIQWAWLAGPVAALLSPVCVGALADNRFAGQKVMGWSGLASGALLVAAFWLLENQFSTTAFLLTFFLASVLAAPMWSMLAGLSMAHLRDGGREFPIVRLGGTLGWMLAGAATSYLLNADSSPVAGYAGGLVRVTGGLLAFCLPATPPPGHSRSLRTLLGVDAFRLLRERDHLVFFSVTALLSVPLAAFYMWTPRHLADLGDQTATATMALGQISELGAMLLMASLMGRFRVKSLLGLALSLSVIRYLFFAWSGVSGSTVGLVIGISLHGMCYTFYFITAQLFIDRRVAPELRSQAQGLLSMVSNGVGMLFGTVAVRALYDQTVAADHGGWVLFWAILAGLLLILTVVFSFSYTGLPAAKKSR